VKRIFASILMLLAAVFATVARAAPSAAQPSGDELEYIQAGHVLADPDSGRIESQKTIVVQKGIVLEIVDGYRGEPDRVIDLRDKFVLPGLIDSHVHLTFPATSNLQLYAVTKGPADQVIEGAAHADVTLMAGFTTVANLGADQDVITALRDGIAEGKVPGPRIVVAGGVPIVGGHGDMHGYRRDILSMFERETPGLCSGAEDCRRAVREMIKLRSDAIKIACTGGVMSDTDTGVGQLMTDDELTAVVQTAHALGRQVFCHAHTAAGINAALRAGVNSIEHGTYLDDESIELLKRTGAYLVPTMVANVSLREQAARETWMAPNIRAKALRAGIDQPDRIRKAYKAGVKFAFGTDSPIAPHGQNAREFSLLVASGFTPLDAIRTATVWGARHLRLADQVGALKAGMAADLIAVDTDPLQDVRVLERVRFVMKAGRSYYLESATLHPQGLR
jgi:imidazolonepropionase-like amidohydrolase